jgi:hypothetical protein
VCSVKALSHSPVGLRGLLFFCLHFSFCFFWFVLLTHCAGALTLASLAACFSARACLAFAMFARRATVIAGVFIFAIRLRCVLKLIPLLDILVSFLLLY